MPETTPLIKAALNLRGGAGFDVYDRIRYHRKRAEHKSHTGQLELYLKNKSNLLLWQVQSGASCLILQVR